MNPVFQRTAQIIGEDGVELLARKTAAVFGLGGIGSMRGAFVAALLVGLVDTIGRAFLPLLLRATLPPSLAADLGPLFAEVSMYALMAAVLAFRPAGLFSAKA